METEMGLGCRCLEFEGFRGFRLRVCQVELSGV